MATPDHPPSQRICLAALAGAHGVRGAVRLKSFTDDPAAITRYGPLYLGDSDRQIELRLLSPVKGGWTAAITGIHDRDAAQALSGTRLYIDRALLDAAADEPDSSADTNESSDGESSDSESSDSYFLVDLIGLKARAPDGRDLGMVRAVHDFGGGDLLDISLHEAAPGLGKSILIPFDRQFVPEVALKAGYLVLDLAAWLALQSDHGPETDR
ncbi:ribosome maturation factor RimM [Iodidimonas nitroreducens]|uniref:Ribosome maturation factor RimM n=1 Tax=Iodidimonas nitroreducens TaxID=1236968 RepID=A0A5A7N9G5_9PROT|nr:PRC-barrel domain-containing protein [Iodidimonas nitroreducens]GAK34282.1 ribosome maturation factor RimM [alpha proteobacterium Q-1]GER04738.1 ribosome maturation factor RimM [Iodidimonas nitroreducens]